MKVGRLIILFGSLSVSSCYLFIRGILFCLCLFIYFFLLLKDCKEFHQAKDGDGWVEQSSQPFFFGLLQKVCIFIKVEEPLYLLYWPFSARTSLFCSRKGNSFSLRTWKEKIIIKKIVSVMTRGFSRDWYKIFFFLFLTQYSTCRLILPPHMFVQIARYMTLVNGTLVR